MKGKRVDLTMGPNSPTTQFPPPGPINDAKPDSIVKIMTIQNSDINMRLKKLLNLVGLCEKKGERGVDLTMGPDPVSPLQVQ